MIYAFFEDKKKVQLFFLFLTGVVIGTMAFHCLNAHEQTKMLIYSDYLSGRVQTGSVYGVRLFGHVLLYRSKEILVLIILGLTQYRFPFHCGIVCYLGIRNSLLVCMLTVMKEQMAIIWYFVLMMPQIILHAYLVYYIIRMFDFDYVITEQKGRMKKILSVFLLLLGMSLLEAFANPFLLKCFSKII